MLGSLEPLRAVTEGEAEQVAISVGSGRPCRLIGSDGVPLVTAHGTRLTEADRRLAAGETGVVPPDLSMRTVTNRVLRLRVTRAWNQSSDYHPSRVGGRRTVSPRQAGRHGSKSPAPCSRS